MLDQPTPPTGERRSLPLYTAGLPILSTEPLTASERELSRRLARALRLAADNLDAAVARGRVSETLQAAQHGIVAGDVAAQLAATLGSGR